MMLIGSLECLSMSFVWHQVKHEGIFLNTTSFLIGDVVNFNYDDGHNVEAVSKDAFEGCDSTDHAAVPGPISWTAPGDEGVTYVVCGVPLHCSLGNQKLAITVSNSC